MIKLYYAVHWLAHIMEAHTKEMLVQLVNMAVSAKATSIELMYHALNHLSAKDTAEVLIAGGVKNASMCMFFPMTKEGVCPMGDPLSDDPEERKKAVANFEQTLEFIKDLRTYGITIDMIAGPNCFVLGKNYGMPDSALHSRIVRFYRELEVKMKEAKVRIAIELLRSCEDSVISTVANLCVIIDLLKSSIKDVDFGAHYDTFHIAERGYCQWDSIIMLGDRIIHLHLNGFGRLPAGFEGETINWKKVILALAQVGKLDALTTTYEPFCENVRKAVPELGEGLADFVPEPAGMLKAREGLEKSGVVFLVEA